MSTETKCCSKPSIQNFDYKFGPEVTENRICLSCQTHWHKGRVFDKNRWAEMMDSKTEYEREFFQLSA